MTVTYLKDGRIEVKDPHDALLLSLAGVKLINKRTKAEWRFGESWQEISEYCRNNSKYSAVWFEEDTILYVPADVAGGLVTVDERMDGKRFVDWACVEHAEDMKDGCIMNFMDYRYQNFYVFLRRHNDRWNLLPDIEMEK